MNMSDEQRRAVIKRLNKTVYDVIEVDLVMGYEIVWATYTNKQSAISQRAKRLAIMRRTELKGWHVFVTQRQIKVIDF